MGWIRQNPRIHPSYNFRDFSFKKWQVTLEIENFDISRNSAYAKLPPFPDSPVQPVVIVRPAQFLVHPAMNDLGLNERESSKDDLTVRDDPFLHFLRDAIIERFYCYNWFYDSLAKNLEFVLSGIPGHGMQTGPAFSSKRVFVITWFWNNFVAIQWAPIRIKHLTDKCVYPMTTIGKCNIHPRKGQSLTKFHFYPGSMDDQTFRTFSNKKWQFKRWMEIVRSGIPGQPSESVRDFQNFVDPGPVRDL